MSLMKWLETFRFCHLHMQLRLSSAFLHHHSGTITWPDGPIAWKYLVTDLSQSHEPRPSFLLIQSSSKASFMLLINTIFAPDVNKYLEHSGNIIRPRWNIRVLLTSELTWQQPGHFAFFQHPIKIPMERYSKDQNWGGRVERGRKKERKTLKGR